MKSHTACFLTAKELLGHETKAMTIRYAHQYPESLRSSIEILDKCDKRVTINKFGEEAGFKKGDKSFKIKHGSV